MNIAQSPKQRFALIIIIASISSLTYFLLKRLFVFMKNTSENSANLSTTSSLVIDENIKQTTFATVNRKEVTNAGVISAGKIYVKIINIGDADGFLIINNEQSTLAAGDTWQYPDDNRDVRKLLYEIGYNATGTKFLIETESN